MMNYVATEQKGITQLDKIEVIEQLEVVNHSEAPEQFPDYERDFTQTRIWDNIDDIQADLERAEMVFKNIVDDYFLVLDANKERDKELILNTFKDMRIKATIVDDYMFSIRNHLKRLEFLKKSNDEQNNQTKK